MEIWQQNVQKLGEELVRRYGISSFPISPFEIARHLGIDIEPLPADEKSVSGMLLESNNNFGIMYATYIDQIGFQHFSIAHEIGHYSIPGHPEKLLKTGIHRSHAGFTSDERCELEADHFAASLLMPSHLFDPALNKQQSGYKGIEQLAQLCQTSLTATAIRYTQRTPDAVAIVISDKKTIDYCFMSPALKDIEGLTWIAKNTPVPKNTATYRFNLADVNVRNGNFVECDTSFEEWFGGSKPFELYEEVKGLGSYGKTLTVLSADKILAREEIDEDDEIVKSWEIKFRK